METMTQKKPMSPADIVLRYKEKRSQLSPPKKKKSMPDTDTTSTAKLTSATEIMTRITESEKHLRKGNLFSSIISLREVMHLYIHLATANPKDKATLGKVINEVLRKLSSSHEFIDLYGKVLFRDNDFETSFDFLCQLIKIKEEEIASVLENNEPNRLLNLGHLSPEDQQTAKLMISLVERGELSQLRELVEAHDNLGGLVLAFYNESGISYRKTGDIDKAIIEYKKALSIAPKDEHLHYNMARAYVEIGQRKNAEEWISLAVEINPGFQEGLRMQKYIEEWPR